MFANKWQVQVFGGVADIDVTNAPVKFGKTTLMLGEDGGDLTEPLIYGPVVLASSGSWLAIRTTQMQPSPHQPGVVEERFTNHREMQHVLSWEFDWTGALRAEGLESRPDGTAVFATWEISPYEPDDH